MKMESIVTSPVSGKVQKVAATEGDSMSQGDLICLSKPLDHHLAPCSC